MAKRPKKTPPRKIKTLVPEPNWDRLMKVKTEEQRIQAWKECEPYCHAELSSRETNHSMKKWVLANMDVTKETVTALPDVYLNSISKNGWKAVKLGYMPEKYANTVKTYLEPLFDRAFELRDQLKNDTTVPIQPELYELDHDHWLHPKKVIAWLEVWKRYLKDNKKSEESPDSKVRLAYQTAQTYVHNMNAYLRSEIWSDTHYGERRESRCYPVCVVFAYDEDGCVKRTQGTFYPDIGEVWKG